MRVLEVLRCPVESMLGVSMPAADVQDGAIAVGDDVCLG